MSSPDKFEKIFAAFTKDSTFAITVLAALQSAKTAYQGESFAFIGLAQICLLCDFVKHLGGFLF